MPWSAPFLFPVVEIGFAYAQLRYGIDLRQASPIDCIRRARIPVLLIHGLADRSILPLHSRLLQAANPAISELWEVPGAGHTEASTIAPDEFDQCVADFLSRSRSAHSARRSGH
jgi:pimeloyl-ACP methyl ester carboxylesterase